MSSATARTCDRASPRREVDDESDRKNEEEDEDNNRPTRPQGAAAIGHWSRRVQLVREFRTRWEPRLVVIGLFVGRIVTLVGGLRKCPLVERRIQGSWTLQ
jgi:hypothetical protein